MTNLCLRPAAGNTAKETRSGEEQEAEQGRCRVSCGAWIKTHTDHASLIHTRTLAAVNGSACTGAEMDAVLRSLAINRSDAAAAGSEVEDRSERGARRSGDWRYAGMPQDVGVAHAHHTHQKTSVGEGGRRRKNTSPSVGEKGKRCAVWRWWSCGQRARETRREKRETSANANAGLAW